MPEQELVFAISLVDLQDQAHDMIGRELSEEEVRVAKKMLEFGLLTDIDTVFRAIFSELLTREAA